MDDRQAHATSLESGEDWIVKYRAALNSDLSQRAPASRYREAFNEFARVFIPAASRVVGWARAILEKGRTTVQSRLSPFG